MQWGKINERSVGLSCSDSGEFKVEGRPRHLKVACKNSAGVARSTALSRIGDCLLSR